jgi:hypothetical protein
MMKQNTSPKWFRPLAVGLLLWNLLGAYACVQQFRVSAGIASLTDPYQQNLYSSPPPFYNWLFVGAELTGIAGAISLVGMKSNARPFFIVSLAFIVLQFGYLFATTNLVSHTGFSATVFPMLVFSIGLLQIWAANAVRRRN